MCKNTLEGGSQHAKWCHTFVAMCPGLFCFVNWTSFACQSTVDCIRLRQFSSLNKSDSVSLSYLLITNSDIIPQCGATLPCAVLRQNSCAFLDEASLKSQLSMYSKWKVFSF